MSDPFLGEIKLFAFGRIPRGYLACRGQLLPVAQYQALFTLIGTTYGGDGRSTFKLPDLQSRAPIGLGSSLPWGLVGGVEQVTLLPQHLPAHAHAMTAVDTQGNRRAPQGNHFASDSSVVVDFFGPAQALVPIDGATLEPAGGGLPHSNIQPSLAVNFCIAIQGLYPTRP
ncbi:phage tail protein [Sphingomonas sp. 37zxx]|uniref:phage tail protein n=1 Tax=Sphingomonas sp. 37zxx TaxID=1550073 RepID=UPI00053C02AB|nr:tail fiber protein [Sphingomonas sp. 37zxx]